jgi:hypothetical protein
VQLGEDADPAYIGDRAASSLWRPKVELTRWAAEECLTLELEGFDVTGDPTLSGNGLSRREGNTSVCLYAPTSRELEWEIILHSRPLVSEWSYRLSGHAALEFLYQGELSGDESGNRRPENVVGSYAIYHATKRQHITGRTNYRCGKLFHLYRPRATDDHGNQAWGTLTKFGDRLIVGFDRAWLDGAAYPVTIDPNLGYDSVGATEWTNQTTNWWITNYGGLQAGSDGVGDKLWFAPADAYKYKTAVYGSLDLGERLSNSYENTSPTADVFNSIDISGESLTITNGNSYYTAWCGDDVGSFCGMRYDGGSGGDSGYLTSRTYTSEMVDPGPSTSTGSARVSIYLEYIEAAAGGARVMVRGLDLRPAVGGASQHLIGGPY